jgi:hypothetical protein
MGVMMAEKRVYWMVERKVGLLVLSLAAKLADKREFYWVGRKVEMLVVWMAGRKDGKWAGKMASW